MPDNWVGWAMFVFFSVGALGGWLVVGAFIVDIYRGFKAAAARNQYNRVER